MESELIKAIKQIFPSGPDGFEGLIAKLLTELTGRQFILAKSGSQKGRDMSVRQINSNVIVVECKRYDIKSKLNSRELIGEIEEAVRDIPDLDLWVLVTSKNISSQLSEVLHQIAQKNSIEFFSISDGDGEPSSLEALCASSSETVISFTKSDNTEQHIKLLKLIGNIVDMPNFSVRVQNIKDTFLSPTCGYDNWRINQNKLFCKNITSEKESRAYFGQLLNVGDTNIDDTAKKKFQDSSREKCFLR